MGLFDRLKKVFSVEEKSQDTESVSQSVSKEQDSDTLATSEQVSSSISETLDSTSDDIQMDSQTIEGSQSVSEEVTESATESTSEEVLSEQKTADSVEQNAELSEASEQESTTSEVTESEYVDSTSEINEDTPQAIVEERQRYDQGLKKTRSGFGARINALLANFRRVDEDFFEELEETLIESDVGFNVAMKISEELRQEVKLQNAKHKSDVSNVIIQKIVDLYEEEGNGEDSTLHFAQSDQEPTVFLFVGVNGVGKTTTIGKLANRYKNEGKKVLLAACDTFRAGAIQQLDEWAKRDGVDIVKKPEKSDPASVAFDAVQKAKSENYDILLVDTAGRLQNKVNLMNELAKIKKVIQRELPNAPQEVLLALDATTGQNALNQAKQFNEVTDVTGIILTKLDGTARGGIVLAIRQELHIPVKLVGLGEKVDDLRDFNAEEFMYGVFKGLITQ